MKMVFRGDVRNQETAVGNGHGGRPPQIASKRTFREEMTSLKAAL